MNKRITSLLLCFLMVFGMLVTTAEHTHAASKPTASIEASTATANPGDEVEFTIYIQSPIDVTAFQLFLEVPEGLTFVSGSLTDGLKSNLGMTDGDVDWLNSTQQLFIASFAPLQNIKDAPMAVATFTCKVNDDAALGKYKVNLTTEFEGDANFGGVGDVNMDMMDPADFALVGAEIEVVAEPVAIESITLNATTKTVAVGETFTLTATVNPSAQNEGFVWTTDDSSVASITGETETITVTAGKVGTATITIAGKNGEKSATCVVTVTCNHEWSTTLVNTDPTGHYYECGKCGEKKDVAAHSATNDKDCATADLCSCGYTVTAAGEHTAQADDGDCQTPVSCANCSQIVVAAKTHVAAADDGDCTTAVLCANKGCTKEVVAAKAHVAGEDDGDCTTAVKCVNCDKNAIEAKEAHVATKDDGDCSTAVKCENCDHILVEAKQHSFSSEWSADKAEGHYHICVNDGCEAIDAIVEHVPGPEATPSKPQVCTECGYELVPATNQFVEDVNVTVAKPVLGKNPSYDVTVKDAPAGTIGEISVVWHVIAEENYTNTDADVWEVMDPEAVFEEGFVYSCDVILYPVEGYEIATTVTVKVNGKAHNNAFGDAYQGDYIYVCGVFKPVDPNNPETGDNSNMMLWFTMMAVSAAGVIGAYTYDKKRKRA